MARIGYVGLGVMGGGVARRLLSAGHEVTGYNRTRSKAEPLIADGMRFAETPREAAEQTDVIFSMVTNTQALTAITHGPDGILAGLGPGKVYVDMSTVSPGEPWPRRTRRRARRGMLDAPVSGSVITLEQGKLSVMVGGDREAFERVDADPARHRPHGHVRRRQRPGRAHEDRDQPQPRGADAGLQRGRPARREGRDIARGRRQRAD